MQPRQSRHLIQHVEGGILVLTLTETLPDPDAMGEAMGAAIVSTGCSKVVLSCRAVRSFVSGSFYHLLKLRRKLKEAGGRLVLCNLAPTIKEVFQATRLDEVFEMRGDVATAVDSLAMAETWLAWNDGTIVKLARSIYHDQDFALLPILADALEDAGCRDAEILAHCRLPGLHARGCWLIDMLRGRS